jgi:pilus assembly protein Flp/PilA
MLRRAKNFALRLWRDEEGASLLEYSVLIGIILAVTVTAVIAIGTWANNQWTTLQGSLPAPTP